MSETHEHTREFSGRYVRVTCSCLWVGPWRWKNAYLIEKELHSDDNQHLYAVRREQA